MSASRGAAGAIAGAARAVEIARSAKTVVPVTVGLMRALIADLPDNLLLTAETISKRREPSVIKRVVVKDFAGTRRVVLEI